MPKTLINTEYDEKRLISSIFSICFGLNNGFLTLNGDNKNLHAKNALS